MLSRLRRILYVVESPITAASYRRFGLGWARAHGLTVCVIDVANIVFPHIHRDRLRDAAPADYDLRIVSTAKDFARELAARTGFDLLVNLMQADGLSRRRLALFRAVSRSGLPTATWGGSLVPGVALNTFARRAMANPRRLVAMAVQKDWLTSVLHRVPPRWLGIRPADFHVSVGDSPLPVRMAAAGTRHVSVPSPDHEAFQAVRGRAAVRQAVFLDQWLPLHSDYQVSGTPPVEAGPYFAAMRRLFDLVEARYGLPMVIAGHPRADYAAHPGVYGQRPIVVGETAQLCAESALVLAHTTTAVGFAVLAERPVLLVATRPLWSVGVARYLTRALAGEIGAPVVFADEAGTNDLPAAPTIDAAKYARYVARYLKRPDVPDGPSWEIAFRVIDEALARKLLSAALHGTHGMAVAR